ncbi:MepB family protein [Leucobacter komagatae]|uniref:MepB family protein n=1 Tax=Leucobacter komagatae TaxID=55969 RepID=UPI000AEF6742|nr:MepB family protein [Leucobacter komagatae]
MRFSSFERLLALRHTEAGGDGGTAAAVGPTVPVEGPWPEEESSGYESGTVRIDGELWRIRTARVTPTKPGAFVAVWERGEDGATRPFASDDRAEGLLVLVDEGERFGVFRFSRTMLAELGITRSNAAGGKRGFRVYPAWSTGLNAQATRTQRLQAPAFERLA